MASKQNEQGYNLTAWTKETTLHQNLFELGAAQTYLRLQRNRGQSAHDGGCKTTKSGGVDESLRAIK